VLIHAGPPKAALSEMARVTRGGGYIGAIEWLPFFAVSSNRPDSLEAFNAIFRKACYEYFVSLNLARHFHSAGLKDIRVPKPSWLTPTIWTHTPSGAPSLFIRCPCSFMWN
jgi:hypothetical protein